MIETGQMEGAAGQEFVEEMTVSRLVVVTTAVLPSMSCSERHRVMLAPRFSRPHDVLWLPSCSALFQP